MRVLHVTKFYPPFFGGMEVFVQALARAQRSAGAQVTVLAHGHRRAPLSVESDAGVEVVRAPCWGRFIYAPLAPSFGWWLDQTVRRTKPDLIHFHLPNTSAFWALALPAVRRLPWIIHWHSDVVGATLDWRLRAAYALYAPFESAMLRHAQAVIATSPPYLESSPTLRKFRSKCVTVPLGLPDLPAITATEPSVSWNANHPLRILAIGRLTYYKGYFVLIEALRHIPQAQLIIVGDGELRDALVSHIGALGLQDRVRLVGAVDDDTCRQWLATCTVLCLASLERTEAFGVVLLEAMRAGRAIVCTNIPGSGVGWIVTDGENGLIARPGDAVDLALKLRSLLCADRTARLGLVGRRKFEDQFDIRRAANIMLGLYSACIEGQPPTSFPTIGTL